MLVPVNSRPLIVQNPAMFKTQILGFLFFTTFFLAVDFYVWSAIMSLGGGWQPKTKTLVKYVYWGFTAFMFLFFLIYRSGIIEIPAWLIKPISGIVFAITIAKLFWVVFLLVDDIIRLFRWLYAYFFTEVESTPSRPWEMSRLKFLQFTGLGIGAAFIGTSIWGIFKGAHNYTVHRVKLKIANLPDAFKGLKIVQISDIHSGSFWDREAVERGVQMINDQKADMVFFTGDIVNDRSSELVPWMDLFSKIKAPLGVYSTLGNHDYGDYVGWPSMQAKKQNLQDLIGYHKQMGWDILMDEHRVIEKDGAKLSIIGIQNWSDKGRFPKYGDLAKAYQGVPQDSVKLLLSHDPSHWKKQVLQEYPDIDCTFSGHTHGMQFGIDTKFYRWSPVKMVYKEWIDLYREGNQQLYVNRGFGYLGYPGRMGIYPEISVFELERA